MELFSAPWWSALTAIIFINLVLGGDNAIVIALAARRLRPDLRRRAIVWGSVGAVVVRSAMTLGVVWLLRIPGLMLVGGMGLLWIAYRLLVTDHDGKDDPGADTFFGAMKTIIVADTLMSVENVLGVAGAAHGSFTLVVIGLALSVPVIVVGSTLVLRLVERFPAVIQLGAAALAYTAAQMICDEALLQSALPEGPVRWLLHVLAIAGVLVAARLARRTAPERG